MSTPGTEAWVRETYGLPCTAELVEIKFCGKRNVKVNKKCARHFIRLGDIFEELAPAYAKQIDDFYDDWTYVCRKIAGTDVYSNHSWGIAIDIDATRNARNGGSYVDSAIWQGARKAVVQAEKEGFRWGGRYSNPDEMHFEVLATPAQLRRWYTRKGKLTWVGRRRLKRRGRLV